MTFNFNIFSVALLISGLALLVMTFLILRRLGGAVKVFGFMMMAISVWALAYGAELASPTLDQMLFWIKFEYFGIALLPALWAVFICMFIGKERWLTTRNLSLIFVLPLMTILLVWTNQWHHLHYARVYLDTDGPFPLLGIVKGPGYIVNTIYFYSTLLWGIYMLVKTFWNSDPIYKKQNSTIIIGALLPWIVNLTYFFEFRPFGHIDLTPYAFILTAFVISYGLLRFRLFDIIPIAREKVMEALKEGVLVLDAKSRVVDINPAMKPILANGNKKVIGLTFLELFPNEDHINDLLSGKSNERQELAISVDGSLRHYEVVINSLFESNTVYSGNILLFRDVTEYKQAEDQLKVQAYQLSELNELKDKLFSIISHDLRSPLLSLMDILHMANEGMLTDQELKSFLPALSSNVEYTSGLLDNLLIWSKSQLKGELLNSERFDLKTITLTRLSFQEKQAGVKNITLRDQVQPNTFVVADKSMIQLVVRNLVSNAIKFSNAGDTITISSSTEGNTTTVCVQDTGVGIKETELEKMFKMETFSTRGTNNELGTGLGLLLCKEFVEKNGGTIWVISKYGKGSSFYFTLPMSD